MSWLIAHLIGDYLLQNDYMAIGKKRSTPICLLHVALYTLAVFALTLWPWWAIAIVAVTHFIQDRTSIIIWWMRTIGQSRFMMPDTFDPIDFRVIPGLGPWSIIVVDNVWHLVVLYGLSLAVGT